MKDALLHSHPLTSSRPQRFSSANQGNSLPTSQRERLMLKGEGIRTQDKAKQSLELQPLASRPGLVPPRFIVPDCQQSPRGPKMDGPSSWVRPPQAPILLDKGLVHSGDGRHRTSHLRPCPGKQLARQREPSGAPGRERGRQAGG